MNLYKLEGRTPVAVDSLEEWGRIMQTLDRHVALTKTGDAEVSTVFLGIDHSFTGGTPILFESMVFGGGMDGAQRRYTTWEQAAAGHAELVKEVLKWKL